MRDEPGTTETSTTYHWSVYAVRRNSSSLREHFFCSVPLLRVSIRKGDTAMRQRPTTATPRNRLGASAPVHLPRVLPSTRVRARVIVVLAFSHIAAPITAGAERIAP